MVSWWGRREVGVVVGDDEDEFLVVFFFFFVCEHGIILMMYGITLIKRGSLFVLKVWRSCGGCTGCV